MGANTEERFPTGVETDIYCPHQPEETSDESLRGQAMERFIPGNALINRKNGAQDNRRGSEPASGFFARGILASVHFETVGICAGSPHACCVHNFHDA
jgi:hypothetical protein